MTFNDSVKEFDTSMTKSFPRRAVMECERCHRLHRIVTRHAGYGLQLWYEVDGKLTVNPPCKEKG